MKKQIISLLTLMTAFASASFAEGEPSVSEAPVMEDSVKAIVDSAASTIDSAIKTTNSVATTLESTTEEVADSAAADTTDPYVPYSEGLFFRPEVGGGIMVASSRIGTKSNFDASAGVNLGYQLNTNLSIGFGISFYYSSMTIENFDEVMAWSPTLRDEYVDKVYRLPIYIMGRWKFTPRKLTPFVDGRFGYAVGLNEYKFQKEMSDPGISTENSGLFLELEAGVQYKNFSVAVVLNRFACKDADPDYRTANGWDNIKNNYSDSYIGLKIGFDITFNNSDEEESEETEDLNSPASKQ